MSLESIISDFAAALGGGLVTGIAWISRFLYQARKDIDYAHDKIRAIEQKLKESDTCKR